MLSRLQAASPTATAHVEKRHFPKTHVANEPYVVFPTLKAPAGKAEKP
jgi:hypothetical protein